MKTPIFILCSAVFLCSCRVSSKGPVVEHAALVPVDSATKMVDSYLNSINFEQNDSDIRSISFSAKELRYYLDSLPESANIQTVNIKLAHNLNYINNGGKNQPGGYNRSALTMIIVGVDLSGNYIFADGNKVIDRGTPCPTNCPEAFVSIPSK